jgi:hypothetical protein
MLQIKKAIYQKMRGFFSSRPHWPLGARLFFWSSIFLATYGYLAPLAAAEKNDCVLKHLELAHAIKNREPVSKAQIFKVADKRVYAFVRLDCRKFGGEAQLIFYRNSKRYLALSQKVYASDNFRTWAYVTARKGDWKLELRINEKVFGERMFVVKE